MTESPQLMAWKVQLGLGSVVTEKRQTNKLK